MDWWYILEKTLSGYDTLNHEIKRADGCAIVQRCKKPSQPLPNRETQRFTTVVTFCLAGILAMHLIKGIVLAKELPKVVNC